MGRRYGIEQHVCDEIFTLADPTGRGEADAQQFRHAFLLLDRHGFHQINHIGDSCADMSQRKMLRGQPGGKTYRPAFRSKSESLQRFAGQMFLCRSYTKATGLFSVIVTCCLS